MTFCLSAFICVHRRLNALRVKPVFDCLPVHYVPPGRQVIRTAVLILQVVGVFPNVAAEHDVLAFHDRAVLVRGGGDLDTGRRLYQPCPAGTEAAHPGGVEFFLEGFEAAEGADDGLRHVTHRRAARVGAHDLPEHGVVDVAAAIVAHGGADVLRHDGAVFGE